MEGAKDCPICCETCNKSKHAEVICEFGDCNYSACKCCIRTYLLNTTLDPHCMQCKKLWSKEFIVNNLNTSWVQKEYKEHRSKLLLDREISKIPDTIPMAEKAQICKEIEGEREKIRQERLKLNNIVHELSRKERQCNRRIRDIENHKDGPERRVFIMPCQNDDCRGYISNSYKCDLCKMFTCSKCHELIGFEKDRQHVCKEENVQSVKTIRENTKPCPKCGTRIQKIDGCDQMWCPQDQVAFSWRTGQIDAGHVHNPHYYEYQRRVNNGQVQRNPHDNPCNQICSTQELRSVYLSIRSKINKLTFPEFTFPDAATANSELSRAITSLELVNKWITNLWWIVQQTIRNKQFNCRQTMQYFERSLTHIRVKYINKEISKEKMSERILKLDKTRAKEQATVQIYDIIMEVGKEHFNTLAKSRSDDIALQEQLFSVRDFCTNIQNILIYFNEEMRKISMAYNVTVEQIESTSIDNGKFLTPRGIYIINKKFNKKTLHNKCTINREQILNECRNVCNFYQASQEHNSQPVHIKCK